jgi:hypothetical protein
MTQMVLRSGGSAWLREELEAHVRITEGHQVTAVACRGDELTLTLDDGTSRTVDHVLLGTGYKFDAERLSFLDPELRAQVALSRGYPDLTRSFESSSVHGLFFAGFPAEGRFGPVARFIYSTPFTAPRIAAAVRNGPAKQGATPRGQEAAATGRRA